MDERENKNQDRKLDEEEGDLTQDKKKKQRENYEKGTRRKAEFLPQSTNVSTK